MSRNIGCCGGGSSGNGGCCGGGSSGNGGIAGGLELQIFFFDDIDNFERFFFGFTASSLQNSLFRSMKLF